MLLSSFSYVYSEVEQLNCKLTEGSVLVAYGFFGLVLWTSLVNHTVSPAVNTSEGGRNLHYTVLCIGKQLYSWLLGEPYWAIENGNYLMEQTEWKKKISLNFTSEAAVFKWLIFILNLLRYLLTSPSHLHTHTHSTSCQGCGNWFLLQCWRTGVLSLLCGVNTS